MPYDSSTPQSGRSAECDAEALAAAKEAKSRMFHTNDADPANTHETPTGNPDAPDFTRSRKIGQ